MTAARLRLLIAQRCNLRCSYCHFQRSAAPKKNMPLAVATDAMRAFARGALERGVAEATLSCYGGEPLLNPDVLLAAFAEVAALARDGFQFRPIINTNGTLLTPELADALVLARASVHVSLDGPDAASNAMRVNYVGKPSFDQARRGLALLAERDVDRQLNVIVTDANRGVLGSLLDLAASAGCARMFVALPDGDASTDIAAQLADAVLELDARARFADVELIGPWRVALRDEAPDDTWPPLDIIVHPHGAAFFPQWPEHELPSVAAVFAPEHAEQVASLGDAWRDVLRGCEGCALRRGCRGYLKLMSRYHTGDLKAADVECAMARSVRERAGDRRQRALRTTVDLAAAVDGDSARVWNRTLPQLAIETSRDVLAVLDYFATGGTPAGLARTFDVEDLDDTVDALEHAGLIAAQGLDTDRRLLDQWAPRALQRRAPGIVVGVADAGELSRVDELMPVLARAREQLPHRLRPLEAVIYAARDRAELATVMGRDPGWMAATIVRSTLVLDLDALVPRVRFGGRAMTEALVRDLVHELAHLGLRQRGLRVPVWLEEGLAEHLAGRVNDDRALLRARDLVPAFCELARRTCGAGEPVDAGTWLLALSQEPIDTNPAYALARDFVAWWIARDGLDAVLDMARAWGTRGLVEAFDGDIDGQLAAWRGDLEARVTAAERTHAVVAPYRVVAAGTRGIAYHRMVGGHVTFTADAAALASLTGRNLELEELRSYVTGALPPQWQTSALPERGIHQLRLVLQDGCNLRCSYCYEDTSRPRGMAVELADRAIATWRDLLEPADLPRATIRFFGGEPLIEWDVIAHVLDTVDRGWPGIGPRFTLNTNGTLLTDDHVARLAQVRERLLVTLSCDGVAESHDRTRLTVAGRPTFAVVAAAARKLASASIPLVVSAVVGEHNVGSLDALVAWVDELRSSSQAMVALALEPMMGCHGMGDQSIADAYAAAVEQCWQRRLPVTGKLLYAFEALVDDRGATGHFCSATGAELAVGPAGELVVCKAMPGSYGSLDDVIAAGALPLPADVRTRHAGRIEACSGCAVEGLCGGGCMAQAQLATGDLRNAPGTMFCTQVRRNFERAVVARVLTTS